MPSASAKPLRSRRTAAITSASAFRAGGGERRVEIARRQRGGDFGQPLELEGEERRMRPRALRSGRQRLFIDVSFIPQPDADPFARRNICNWRRNVR